MDLRDKYGVDKRVFSEVTCPVCGKPTLDSFWICENCFWECDDPNIAPDVESGPNHCTVSEYKEKMSRKLAFLLRHSKNPRFINLQGGWADVDVITKEMFIGKNFLEQIVANDEKGRFSFDSAKTKIRANNGHSISGVVIETIKKQPPEILYHGTAARFLESIMSEGLKPMNRLNVQLSVDLETALKVGSRHGEPVVLEIKAEDFVNDGNSLLLSPNGVWLAAYIPKEYLKIHEQNS